MVRPKPHRTLAGGLLGSSILIPLMYVIGDLALGKPMDVALILAGMLGYPEAIGVFLFILANVLIFPLMYWFIAAGALWGPPWARGMEWGLLLWFFSELASIATTAGSMMRYQQYGMVMLTVSFAGHLAYGVVFGAVAGDR